MTKCFFASDLLPHFLLKEGDGWLFCYINQRKVLFKQYIVYGYSFIPPTPFQLKDWERYDVSRYVDPGCTHPSEGFRTTDLTNDIEYGTIQKDLEELTKNEDLTMVSFFSPNGFIQCCS